VEKYLNDVAQLFLVSTATLQLQKLTETKKNVFQLSFCSKRSQMILEEKNLL
jgi:hypothetical protein